LRLSNELGDRLHKEEDMTEFPEDAGPILTGLARASIAKRLGITDETQQPADREWLWQDGASFITLKSVQNPGDLPRLRGCIGSLEARRPLIEDVTENAQAAAFRDPRFMPVEEPEFPGLQIEVSVLSRPEELSFRSEDDALGQLRPGVDGVILSASGHRATFLPQVWEDLEHPVEFIDHLKRKAGLRFNYWGDDVRLWRYTVTAFNE
jgi:AmmeMemoRadiSam system protein A